jgi:hypothetical protein
VSPDWYARERLKELERMIDELRAEVERLKQTIATK